MHLFRPLVPSLTLSLLASTAAVAAPDVVVSIKPIHSLVAGVMDGVGEPTLIVEGAGSPHTYSMKPSQAAALESADLVFWVSPELEPFLERPLESLTANAHVIALSGVDGLTKMPFREDAAFEGHDHGAEDEHGDHAGHDDHDEDEHHDHAEHDDHDKDDHEEHAGHDDHEEDDHHDHAERDDHDKDDHEEHAGHDDHEEEDHHDHAEHDDHDEDEHGDHAGHDDHDKDDHEEHAGHDHGHHHEHGAIDPHLWLDPVNAQLMVAEIAEQLSEIDPENAERYQANAAALEARLGDLISTTEADLAPVSDRSFVVFHDAYHYFEDRFGLQAAGSITVNPETAPGANRIAQIQDKVRDLGVACVFAEPQFEPKLVSVVVEGSDARSGVLDPLGAGLEDGPDLYFDLITNMTSSFVECLTPAS